MTPAKKPRPRRRNQLAMNVGLALSVCLLFLGAAELFFRLVEYDFAGEKRAWQRVPIYYQKPTVPIGEAFFRRPGPQSTTDRVLHTRVEQLEITPNPYADEEPVTVVYDENGFRNPEKLDGWSIVFVGDSFTELGYLPHEALFTTIVGELLEVDVLNLGVSFTGPLTQLTYLRHYGLSPATRQAVMVFFEGNDLKDLDKEYDALERLRTTGEREFREFETNTSLVRAVQRLLFPEPLERPPNRGYVNAYFDSADGKIPVSLQYAPPNGAELEETTRQRLEDVLAEYAAFCREHGVEPWIAYMPAKRRVLHGRVRFTDEIWKNVRSWQPSDLPQFLARRAESHGIEMIDLTPALVETTVERSRLPYNSIFDTHLNALGSRAVAVEMARRLGRPTPPG